MENEQTPLEGKLEGLLNAMAIRMVAHEDADKFFLQCIEKVADFYDIEYAFIGLLDDVDKQLINTFIVWNNGKLLDNFQYTLAGTPCEDVVDLKHEIIKKDVACRYPDDEMLVQMKVESYFGSPLIGADGQLLGLFSIMSLRTLDPAPWMIAVLDSVAIRFSLEIERFKAEERFQVLDRELQYQEMYDSLTGIWNRDALEGSLLRHQSSVMDDQSHAFLYIDLDQFKVINDMLGHTAGDELLRQVVPLLQQNIRGNDLIGRLGGDEFGILLEYRDVNEAGSIAHNILDSLSEFQFQWADKVFMVGASIGVAIITAATRRDNIMANADIACHVAKEDGRNKVRVYEDKDQTVKYREKQMDWLSKITQALDDDRFILYAQPISPTNKDSTSKISYELLVRIIQGENIIPPGEFLPAAERYNQIIAIDRWVVSKAISMLENQTEFLDNIDHVSINLSCQSLASKKFLEYLVDEVDRSDLSEKICFEITETAVISDLVTATRSISILKGMGIRFSLDDFGSGLSSFAYLRTLDVDYLKIDGLFVRNIEEDLIDRAMVKSICEIGSLMGKKVIAEFVENDEIHALLDDMGVDYVQGYGIGKPQPFTELLKNP
jgi:diguanylate cyclase (GGDEF)-like protein